MTEDLLKALEDEVGKCISCGFCESVCPTLPAAGYDLWKGARGRVIMGKEVLERLTSGNREQFTVSDSFYSCLDCYACLYVCPAGVNAGKVSHISREIITEGLLEKNENPLAKMIVSVTMRYMNPLGVRKQCAEWFQGMEADTQSGDLLYTGNMFQLMAYTKNMGQLRKRLGPSAATFMSKFVSMAPSLIKFTSSQRDRPTEEQMNNSLRNIARLLKASGVSFNYLGEEEPYPGTFIYDLGYRDMFRTYAERVVEIFRKAGARRIITIDPHTYDLLVNTYPEYVRDFDFEVVHYVDLIRDLNLKRTEEKITYHEPCHFALRDKAYNAPLETLRKVSTVELPARSGRKTRCCGGPDELLFPGVSEKVSDTRYMELQEVKADRIVTACPICFVNLKKGPKVVEFSDFIADRLQ